MKIIVRTCGERTTDKCIELARRHGQVEVISATPFSECIRLTYLLAQQFTEQKWIPVVDADVLLKDDSIKHAINELNQKCEKIFCLDGKTNDKILMKARRAGIHIYNRELLSFAMKYIDSKQLKPESFIRREMSKKGFITFSSKMIFGLHDYEQYYCDLWRKSVLQSRKLAGMIKRRPEKWKKLSKTDKDFLVIYKGHVFGKNYKGDMFIDKNMDFNAEENIIKLGLTEKGAL